MNDIPKGVQFNILPVLPSDPKPEPLTETPFPFENITIGNDNNGNYFIRFSTFQDERDEKNWNLKWASTFYFRKLIEIDTDDTINVFELDKNGFQIIYVQFNHPKTKEVEDAVNKSISELKSLLKKVELELSGLSDLFNAIDIWKNNTYQ
ncbi:MAG: hypothetical protein U5K69_21790 [Balneolaceae bacterium]|nr:hypothetical protein [Balneolaceae bacterium]